MLKLSGKKTTTEATIYDSKIYKRTRTAYIWDCTFEYFISLLVTDSFLASLLNHLGFSDSLIGIISSLISFAFLFQLLSIIVVQKIMSVKRAAIFCHAMSTLFFMLLFLVPFMNLPKNLRPVIVISAILLAYLSNYLVTSVIFKWAATYVDPRGRARYGARKEKTSLITGIVFSFTMGYAVDKFNAADNIEGAFIFLAAGILVCGILDFISAMLMQTPDEDHRDTYDVGVSILESVKVVCKSKKFLTILLLSFTWSFTSHLTVSFLGIYKTKDLAISMTLIQIINIIGVLTRFSISTPVAKLSDKTSYARGVRFGMTLNFIGFVTVMFTSPKFWWLIIVYTILYTAAQAGTVQNLYNIVFDCVEEKYFVHASAIKSALGGIGGFSASLVGSAILNKIQANGNMIFGLEMRAQQVLATISAILTVLILIYLKFVVEKVLAHDKKVTQEAKE